MCFGMDKTRHPAQPIAKQNVPDARRVHPKDFPALILTYRAGNLHIKALSLSKNQISGKKEVNQNGIFYNSSNRIKDSRNSNRGRRRRMGRHQSA